MWGGSERAAVKAPEFEELADDEQGRGRVWNCSLGTEFQKWRGSWYGTNLLFSRHVNSSSLGNKNYLADWCGAGRIRNWTSLRFHTQTRGNFESQKTKSIMLSCQGMSVPGLKFCYLLLKPSWPPAFADCLIGNQDQEHTTHTHTFLFLSLCVYSRKRPG